MVVYLLTTLIFLNLIASSVYLLLKGLLFWAKDRIDERFRYIGCIAVMLLFLIPFYQVLPVSYAHNNTLSLDTNCQEEISVIIPTEKFREQENLTNETNVVQSQNLHLDLWIQKSILTIWAVGSATLALWHLSTLLWFRWRLSKKQTEPVDIELQQMANLCAKEYGLRPKPSLRVLPDVQGPMLIGFMKPIIVVSENSLPLEDASMILKHEIVHFKRRDLWWKLLGVIIQSVHWFNPIVWLLCKDFEFCVETSCDAEVVKDLDHDERKRYGYLLISYVQLQQNLRSVPGVSFTPAHTKLKRRITVMLKGNRSHKVIAMAIVCVLAASSFAFSAFAAEADANTNKTIDGIVSSKGASATLSDQIREGEMQEGEIQKNLPFATKINPEDGYNIRHKDAAPLNVDATMFEVPLNISDEFRTAVANGEVTPLEAEEGVSVDAIDANGNKKSVNTDVQQYAFCDHRTEDVYIQRHIAYKDGSCRVELYSGVRCNKCGTVWVHDLLSVTSFPQCPHR